MNNLRFTSIFDLSEIEYIRYLGICGSFKRKVIKSYKYIEDRYRAICGEKLIREVIEEVDKIPKEEIIISTDKYGKPFVSESSLCFNVSHSGEFAVIIFDSTSVGVDIEIMKDLDFETILKEFATEFEMQQFYKSSSHQKFFYQLWTLKESYFKCKGTGITNLKEIEFFISDAVIISNKLGYTFETNIFFDNYMVSYCKKS